MWTLSLLAFLLLGGYLMMMGMRYGIPAMVSDTYYQLGRRGWLFTLVMVAVAFLMLVYLLGLGRGIQPFAFIGCCGLAFVGVTPNYVNQDEGRVHKIAATIAAIGCTAWCLSVCPWPTIALALLLAAYLGFCSLARVLNGIWYLSKRTLALHPWYWAEVAAFVDVFVTGAVA